MLLTTRGSARWRNVALVLFAALTAAYLWWHRETDFAHGGSDFGLAAGLAAFGLILLLLSFAVRKRMYASRRLGRLETWLHSHVWLGLLSVALVLYHSGFRFEDGVAVAALVVLVLVVATGAFGALLYTTLPRLLTEVASNVPADRVTADLHRIERSMARLADGRSDVFGRVHRALVARARPGPFAGWRILFGRPPSPREALPAGVAGRLRLVAPEERDALENLLVLSRQHRELHQRFVLERRYANLLQAWLWLHVPLSLALLVLVVVHATAALYYGGWPEGWPRWG